jgi:hypothetical protein
MDYVMDILCDTMSHQPFWDIPCRVHLFSKNCNFFTHNCTHIYVHDTLKHNNSVHIMYTNWVQHKHATHIHTRSDRLPFFKFISRQFFRSTNLNMKEQPPNVYGKRTKVPKKVLILLDKICQNSTTDLWHWIPIQVWLPVSTHGIKTQSRTHGCCRTQCILYLHCSQL